MIDLDKVRAALPMPKLMEQLGLGEKAKPSARCPWHDDKSPSFGIFEKDGRWYFKCHSNCGSGDEVDLIQKALALPSQGDAIRHYADMAGYTNNYQPEAHKNTPKATAIEALQVFPGAVVAKTETAKIARLTAKAVRQLADWRGYSREFVVELLGKRIVGLYDGHIAFPVTNGAHFRLKDGSWRFSDGATPDLFVLGEIEEGAHVHCFESQWDALAFAEATNTRDNIVASRGAGNVKLIVDRLTGHTGTLYLWPQNDDPGQKWARDILAALLNEQIACARIPDPHKDLNEWRQDGASSKDVLQAYLHANTTLSEGAQQTAKLGQPLTPATDVVLPAHNLSVDVLPEPLLVTRGEARESTLERSPTGDEKSHYEADSRGGQNTLATTLDGIVAFLQRYITFPLEEHPIVIALWVAHTHTFKAFRYTPYLHICSPEKRCGKSQLLDCIELLAASARKTDGITAAALRRIIDSESPTLLLDEIDASFSLDKPTEASETIRGTLNGGFKFDGKYICCDGPNNSIREFKTFCPKVLAGIGKIPDTVHDRSLDIPLVRQASDEEQAARFREKQAMAEALPLRAALEKWATGETLEHLASAIPELPDQLTDRQMDMTEPLLAIANMAGPVWAAKGRDALIEVCAVREDQSTGVRLLVSIRRIFAAKGQPRLTTLDLLRALIDEEDADAPWATRWENDFNRNNTRGPAMKLASILEPFGIKPRPVKLSPDEVARGYYQNDFEDAFKRYLKPIKGLETMELL